MFSLHRFFYGGNAVFLPFFCTNTTIRLEQTNDAPRPTPFGCNWGASCDCINLRLKGEVLLTIMASLAQQESQSLSQNVKLGIQYRYQQGKVQVNHNRFLGYTKDADGNLVIDPEQAEIVRRIYREYLQGLSMNKIAAELEADGILTGAGKTKWHTRTINQILRNEKYIGDALLQKTYCRR